MNNAPDYNSISIIIITHNREELVLMCIESVKKAVSLYRGKTELIIVNSSASPLGIKDNWIKEIHVPEIHKPYKKRNIGSGESNFDWLLYLDDDCVVDKEILNILNERINSANDNVGGFYGVTEFFGDKTYASKCCENSNFTSAFEAPKYYEELPWGVAVAPLFRKKALMEVNGFSEQFTSKVGGEDLDFGLKMTEKGWILKGIPKVLSYHSNETWNSYTGNLKRAFRYGMAETGIITNHPEHTFLKLNSLIFITLPVIIDLLLFRSGLAEFFIKVFLYLFITTLFSSIYYTFQNKVKFRYAAGLVFYDRAFEVGTAYSAIITKNPKALFFRFEYQKKRKLLGRNKSRNILIIMELFSIVLTLLLFHFAF